MDPPALTENDYFRNSFLKILNNLNFIHSYSVKFSLNFGAILLVNTTEGII